MQSYIAISGHKSEYPEPLSFEAGAHLIVGEKYVGPENWENWYFCTLRDQPQQPGGWVPAQIIDKARGTAMQSFNARELDVSEDDVLHGEATLNGWVWCVRPVDGCSGWVPVAVLRLA